MNDQKLNILLRSHELILRNMKFNNGTDKSKAEVTCKNISDILNPKESDLNNNCAKEVRRIRRERRG